MVAVGSRLNLGNSGHGIMLCKPAADRKPEQRLKRLQQPIGGFRSIRTNIEPRLHMPRLDFCKRLLANCGMKVDEYATARDLGDWCQFDLEGRRVEISMAEPCKRALADTIEAVGFGAAAIERVLVHLHEFLRAGDTWQPYLLLTFNTEIVSIVTVPVGVPDNMF